MNYDERLFIEENVRNYRDFSNEKFLFLVSRDGLERRTFSNASIIRNGLFRMSSIEYQDFYYCNKDTWQLLRSIYNIEDGCAAVVPVVDGKPELKCIMGVGLVNLSYVCYFNSLLQIIFHLKCFDRVYPLNEKSSPVLQDPEALFKFLFDNYRERMLDSLHAGGLADLVYERGNDERQDASEVWDRFFEYISRKKSKSKGKLCYEFSCTDDIQESYKKFMSQYKLCFDGPLYEAFHTIIHQKLQCKKCGATKYFICVHPTYSVYCVPRISAEDIIVNFLVGNEGDCCSCGENFEVTKYIYDLPEVIVVNLNFDESLYYEQNSIDISLSKYIDLSSCENIDEKAKKKGCKYVLRGIVCFKTEHFFSYVLNDEIDEYFYYSDLCVDISLNIQRDAGSCPKMLFYEMVGV